MFNAINISHIFVFDQEEALAFYVDKLGLEVSNDMNLGFMRWLTVRVPGDTGRDVLLELPGPPGMDEKTAAQVRETVSKGGSGFTSSRYSMMASDWPMVWPSCTSVGISSCGLTVLYFSSCC